MKNINFNILSNAEIRVKLIELENEYSATKNKIRDLMQNMEELDKIYTQGKEILNKRTKGIEI